MVILHLLCGNKLFEYPYSEFFSCISSQNSANYVCCCPLSMLLQGDASSSSSSSYPSLLKPYHQQLKKYCYSSYKQTKKVLLAYKIRGLQGHFSDIQEILPSSFIQVCVQLISNHITNHFSSEINTNASQELLDLFLEYILITAWVLSVFQRQK